MRKNPNEHIKKFLDYYITLSQDARYAILLTGAWGAGKTWFMKDYTQSKKCCFISLFGLKTIQEIHSNIFFNLHPTLGSNIAKGTTQFLAEALKATIRFDASIFKNLVKYESIPQETLLVFDDLERCNISTEDLFGYMNQLVEQQGLRIVLIANEEKISSKQSTYQVIKEKLVGYTFELQPLIHDAIVTFIKNIIHPNHHLQEVLQTHQKFFIELYENHPKYKNLRLLQQSLVNFMFLFSQLTDQHQSNQLLLGDLLKWHTIYYICLKNGELLPEEINAHSQNFLTPHSDTEKIFAAIPDIKTSKLMLGDCWTDFLDKGLLDKTIINEKLSKSIYYQELQPWQQLWHFQTLEQTEFNYYLDLVVQKLNAQQFTDIGEILHTTSILLALSYFNLYSQTNEVILDLAKCNIEKLSKTQAIAAPFFDNALKNSYRDYGFFTNWIPDTSIKQLFEELKIYIIHQHQANLDRQHNQKSIESIELLRKLPLEFVKNIKNDDFQKNILPKIKPSEFIASFEALANRDKFEIERALSQKKLYVTTPVCDWASKLKLALEQKINSIEKTSLTHFHCKKLYTILKIHIESDGFTNS